MNPIYSEGLRAVMDKHPTFSYKEVLLHNSIKLMLFYLMNQDDNGHDYVEDSFVVDLDGKNVDHLKINAFEWAAFEASIGRGV